MSNHDEKIEPANVAEIVDEDLDEVAGGTSAPFVPGDMRILPHVK